MKIDTNPLQAEAHYAEPVGIHMVAVSEDFIIKPIFGSFTGNISRKTIEGVRKATEGLDSKKEVGQGSNKKAVGSLKLIKRVIEDPNKIKGVAESSSKRTTTSSYLAAAKGSTEDLEARMQKMNLAAKSNMQVNVVEVSGARVSEETLRQEEVNKIAFPKEDENLADFLHRCQKKKSEVMLCPRCSSIFDKKAAEHIQVMRTVKEK